MKTIRELRTQLRFQYHEINSSISYVAKDRVIDYDVFLPTKNKNLQRDFVWTIDQKRELIWSVLMNRKIPRMAIVNTYNDVFQVIDGKQRLSSMITFYNGEFTLLIDGKEYFFKDLPTDYQNVISGFMFPYYIADEYEPNLITDEDKIAWFKMINFAGTPQDAEHLKNLES